MVVHALLSRTCATACAHCHGGRGAGQLHSETHTHKQAPLCDQAIPSFPGDCTARSLVTLVKFPFFRVTSLSRPAELRIIALRLGKRTDGCFEAETTLTSIESSKFFFLSLPSSCLDRVRRASLSSLCDEDVVADHRPTFVVSVIHDFCVLISNDLFGIGKKG